MLANSYTSAPGIPSFPIPYLRADYAASSYNPPQSTVPSQNPSTSRSSFKAPAHKHAHHLHSIPPREKSTRTLIIDHMLWVHGRTRFAQARAELGMTDRTGGSSSPHYVHRHRPENYEEDLEESSEGEDVVKLKARAGDPHHPPGDDEDKRLQSQDLILARSLRLRAEGLEKVVTSMLGQPPTIQLWDSEDIWTPPTSPPMKPKNHIHPHKLPNGVRLRLALGTIINDLFARQAPPSPYRHHLQSKSPSQSPSNSPLVNSNPELPVALASLSTVCALGPILTKTNSPGFSRHSVTVFCNISSTLVDHFELQIPSSSSRTRSLYDAGADPSTANSPPSLRCPRHLHTGCEICVEAKTGVRPGVAARAIGEYGGGQAPHWRTLPSGSDMGGGGITGWQDGSGIGSGLLRPGVDGNCLRRKVSGLDDIGSSTGSGNTKLSELIPRFIRLSALVASELAMEAKDTQEDTSSNRSNQAVPDQPTENEPEWAQQQRSNADFQPLPTPMSPPTTVRASNQSQDKVYDLALRPTREWYLLLAGLLTRAALEGYLTAGWRGPQAVECLLTVGLGVTMTTPQEKVELKGFEEFDPDGLPSLLEAARLLFPTSQSSQRGNAEEEYEIQMHERLRRFYDIPSSTPDLSTHMEDLAWQYPAEPVERAALRFCEAISGWRGKPELETYKKSSQNPALAHSPDVSGASSLSIDSLVHSNPPSPTIPRTALIARLPKRPLSRPSIDVYFSQPPRESFWTPNKRRRSPDGSQPGPSKRFNASRDPT